MFKGKETEIQQTIPLVIFFPFFFVLVCDEGWRRAGGEFTGEVMVVYGVEE